MGDVDEIAQWAIVPDTKAYRRKEINNITDNPLTFTWDPKHISP